MDHKEDELKLKTEYDGVRIDSFAQTYERIKGELQPKNANVSVKKKNILRRVSAVAAAILILCCLCTAIVSRFGGDDKIYDECAAAPILSTITEIENSGVSYVPNLSLLDDVEVKQVNHKTEDDVLYFTVMGTISKPSDTDIEAVRLRIILNEKYIPYDEDDYKGDTRIICSRQVMFKEVSATVWDGQVHVGYKASFKDGTVRYLIEYLCLAGEPNEQKAIDFLSKFLAPENSEFLAETNKTDECAYSGVSYYNMDARTKFDFGEMLLLRE